MLNSYIYKLNLNYNKEDLNSPKILNLIKLFNDKSEEIMKLYKNKKVNLNKFGNNRIANIILDEN